tara:strand:+ start:413 stop:1003 length:591 start_codon:yes stop_codon:yes gene_type:complete
MKLNSLFITPVMWSTVTGHEHLADKLYKIKEEDEEGMPRSNVGGWHSKDELYKNSDFQPIVGDILLKAKECFNHLDVKDNFVPELTGLWGMINPPGSRNCIHTHPYNFLSGVYYLKVPKDSGNLIFLEPRPQMEVLSPPRKENLSIQLSHSVQWEPKENCLIFFPSSLQHEVRINNSKEDRVILSFNINWRKNADN